MRKILVAAMATAIICMFIIPAIGDDNQGIDITLNPSAEASILCNQSALTPVCGLGENNATASAWGNLDNNGDVAVDVTINATDTNAWTLASSPGHDQFNFSYTKDDSSYTILATSQETFYTALAHDESQNFGLKLYMATTSSTNNAQITDITFVATVC